MASSADHHDTTRRGDLAAIVAIGLFAASLQQLVASDRITRTPRHHLIRWLNTRPGRWAEHAQYALGCWDCGPVWGALAGHLITRRHRTLASLAVAALASRAVARLAADQIGWSDGFKSKTLPDGTRVFVPSFGRDWPDDIAWVGDRIESTA